MKRFIVLLFLFLMLSCVAQKHTVNKYTINRSYYGMDSVTVVKDVYNEIKKYTNDSIPLTLWITSKYTRDTYTYTQRVMKLQNKEENYVFIFTKFDDPNVVYYEFKIRCTNKK